MYKLKSKDKFHINDYEGYVVDSPCSAERTGHAMIKALGNPIEIDEKLYTPVGVEMHMPASPVRIGEVICIAVKEYNGSELPDNG